MRKFAFIMLGSAVLFCGCKSARVDEPQVDYYQQNYQECLTKARKETAFTHETMKEEALGKKITDCMAQFGWGDPN